MSIVTMNMSSYEIERNDSFEYAEAAMCTECYPDLALQSYTEPTRHVFMPPELLAMDAETFLDRMYAYQN